MFKSAKTQPSLLELIDARVAAKGTQPVSASTPLSAAQLAAVRASIASTPASVRAALANASVAKAVAGAAHTETHFLFRQPALV